MRNRHRIESGRTGGLATAAKNGQRRTRLYAGLAQPIATAAISTLAFAIAASADAASVFIVNTTGDPGPVGTQSLRQAIAAASGDAANVVKFDESLVGSMVTLANGEIAIDNAVTIDGPTAGSVTISGNNSSRIFYAYGCPPGSRVKIARVTLQNGFSALNGGAILARGCDLYLSRTVLAGNHAGLGGAVYSDRPVQIQLSTLTGNSAGDGGAIAIVNSSGRPGYIGQTVIRGNGAAYRGDRIAQLAGELDVAYSEISGNTIPAPPGTDEPQGGGGIFIANGAFRSVSSTIAKNYAYSGGGGIEVADATTATSTMIYTSTIAANSTCCYETGNGITAVAGKVTLHASIVANNYSRAGITDLSGAFQVDGSLVRNPSFATITSSDSVFGLDPLLGPLQGNGGYTRTMLPAANSPAVDSSSLCNGYSIFFDQRRQPRCANGLDDIGAVERQNPEIVIFKNGFERSG